MNELIQAVNSLYPWYMKPSLQALVNISILFVVTIEAIYTIKDYYSDVDERKGKRRKK